MIREKEQTRSFSTGLQNGAVLMSDRPKIPWPLRNASHGRDVAAFCLRKGSGSSSLMLRDGGTRAFVGHTDRSIPNNFGDFALFKVSIFSKIIE